MDLLVPALFALFVWWFSTGAILYLDGRAPDTFALSLIGGTFVLALALIGLMLWSGTATPAAAYGAFVCGLLCWGWQEMTLYLGYITGPRRVAQPPKARGWQRFMMATQAILYHELAIALMGGLLLWALWDAANPIGLWTFLILWWMRLSAKLNIFLGVPNHSAEFLPGHIAYLASYFRKRPMNLFFPISVTVSTLVTAWLFMQAAGAAPGSFEQTGWALLATLMALAVLEHWFLVIPLPVTKLWSWGMSHRHAREPQINTQDDAAVPSRMVLGSAK